MLVPLLLGVLLAAPALPRTPAAAHHPRFLHEFTLPLGAYPSSIIAGPDGALWFSTYPLVANHQPIDLGIGRITTRGKQTFFLIGNGTYDLTLGRDGKIWFTNPYTYVRSMEIPTVGSLTTTGKVVQYPAPDSSPESITTGPDGDLWYTDFGARHDVVRIDEQGRTVHLYRTPRGSAVKVAPGPNGTIWFDALGRRSAVGAITSRGIVKHLLGGPAYIPGPLALGPDGRMWISDCSYVAAVTPAFAVTLYALPYKTSCMWGITAGPDGNMWATDFDTSSLLRIGLDGTMVEYPTPTPNMMPTGITVGPDGNLWFTEIQRDTDVSKVGVLAP